MKHRQASGFVRRVPSDTQEQRPGTNSDDSFTSTPHSPGEVASQVSPESMNPPISSPYCAPGFLTYPSVGPNYALNQSVPVENQIGCHTNFESFHTQTPTGMFVPYQVHSAAQTQDAGNTAPLTFYIPQQSSISTRNTFPYPACHSLIMSRNTIGLVSRPRQGTFVHS